MSEVPFTKDNLDGYLKELSKEFRKMNGSRMPAEIILIGGAAVLINYGFREMTYDMDAIIQASSSMKDAINHVGDRMGLPNGWLNTDFMKTASYTPKLIQYSQYYKTFSNVLRIRTVSAAGGAGHRGRRHRLSGRLRIRISVLTECPRPMAGGIPHSIRF